MPSNSLKRYSTLLRQYLRSQWGTVLLLALLLLISIAVQLFNPQILRAFIDAVGEGQDNADLARYALLFLVLALGGQGMSLLVTYVAETIAWKATNALRLDLVVHCLSLDMSFHKTRTPGELIERIDGDVSTLAEFFSQMALRLLANGLLSGGILILLWVIDWRAGLVGIAYVLLAVFVLRLVSDPLRQAWAGSRQVEAEMTGFFGERITGTEDIRANGAESCVMRQVYLLMRRVSQHWIKAKMVSGIGFDALRVVTLIINILALAVGAWLFYRGQATIGTVYLILSYISQMETPMNAIRRRIDNLQKASASISRVEDLLHTSPTVRESLQPVRSLPSGPLPVQVNGVSFGYDDEPDKGDVEHVLRDVSFSVQPGQVLGLLGRTGSGKTTLSRLLFRLYDPQQGTLELGGVDMRDVSLSGLRACVGLVTQDVQLFRATVRHNLTLFKPGFDDAQLLDALRALGLWSWYESLPQGLDTVLQDGGQGLSAGQAQILAFARVFLRDPGLIILDEASSRLDPATDRQIERAIDVLLADRTVIVIAHRLHTVQRADAVLILEDGQVAEYGARQDLAADPHSRFSGLLRTGLQEVLA